MKEILGAVVLDIATVSDTFSYEGHIYKITQAGSNENIIKIFSSYLRNKFFAVEMVSYLLADYYELECLKDYFLPQIGLHQESE